MEKILNLTDVSDEAFANIAECVQKWKDNGEFETLVYRAPDEIQKYEAEVQAFGNKNFLYGMLWSGVALIASVALSTGIDFVVNKVKNKT